MTMHMDVSDLREERDRYKAEAQWLAELLLVRGAAPAVPPEWKLTPLEARIVGLLLSGNAQRTFSTDEVIQALYWDRQEPEDAANAIDVFVFRIRKKLRPHGVEIVNHYGHGYQMVPCPGAVVVAALEDKS